MAAKEKNCQIQLAQPQQLPLRQEERGVSFCRVSPTLLFHSPSAGLDFESSLPALGPGSGDAGGEGASSPIRPDRRMALVVAPGYGMIKRSSSGAAKTQ